MFSQHETKWIACGQSVGVSGWLRRDSAFWSVVIALVKRGFPPRVLQFHLNRASGKFSCRFIKFVPTECARVFCVTEKLHALQWRSFGRYRAATSSYVFRSSSFLTRHISIYTHTYILPLSPCSIRR